MALVRDMAPPPTRPYTGWEMYHHIINLNSAHIRYRWQHVINHWNVQEGEDFRLGVGRNSIDLTSQMHIFDDLIFDSQLKDRVSVSWSDEIVDSGDCTWNGRSASIRIYPRRYPTGGLNSCHIRETLVHEMLHVVGYLWEHETSSSLFDEVHTFGLTGHGPLFRDMGAQVEKVLNELLFNMDFLLGQAIEGLWDLDISAFGPSHKEELIALGQLDTTGLGGLQYWDFERLEGK